MGQKKFDKELYDKANPLSNGVMAAWLERNGYDSIDLKETYGVDITCTKNNLLTGKTPYFFETEIAYIWKKEWPNVWMFIHIPYRKKKIIDKWVKDGSDGILTFVQFKNDCKQAWFIDGQVVRDAPIKTIDTKYTRNEKFFNIDINDAHMINMKESDIKESKNVKDFNSERYSEYNNERISKKELL
jgi:hypothetical protein